MLAVHCILMWRLSQLPDRYCLETQAYLLLSKLVLFPIAVNKVLHHKLISCSRNILALLLSYTLVSLILFLFLFNFAEQNKLNGLFLRIFETAPPIFGSIVYSNLLLLKISSRIKYIHISYNDYIFRNYYVNTALSRSSIRGAI